jgi:hypothetical protein
MVRRHGLLPFFSNGAFGSVAASHAIRMQTFDSVSKIIGLTDSEGPLHPRKPTLNDFPIFHQKMESGRSDVGFRGSANGRSWPSAPVGQRRLTGSEI